MTTAKIRIPATCGDDYTITRDEDGVVSLQCESRAGDLMSIVAFDPDDVVAVTNAMHDLVEATEWPAETRTPWRPDDRPRRMRVLAEVEADVGEPYVLQRRHIVGGDVIRLAREQANGESASFILGPEDARRVAAALIAAAEELENE